MPVFEALDLRTSPEAKRALDLLREAAAGPFIGPGNRGRAPERSGADIMRPLPVPDRTREAFARAIDSWLAAAGLDPFVQPMRLDPAFEAHIARGMAELCRQRVAARASAAAHPSAAGTGALGLPEWRGPAQSVAQAPQWQGPIYKEDAMPKTLGHNPHRRQQDNATWKKARRLAQAEGRDSDEAFVAKLFRQLVDLPLKKARAQAWRLTVAARCARPTARLEHLAAARAPGRLRKAKPSFAQMQLLTEALGALRWEQKTYNQPTGRGLMAVLKAYPAYKAEDHLAAAERQLKRCDEADSPQGRLDACLLARAHAALALAPAEAGKKR